METCIDAVLNFSIGFITWSITILTQSMIFTFLLCTVYVPRINRTLDQFKVSWNSHDVRTEPGKTPNQLFTEGALRLHNSGLIAVDFF